MQINIRPITERVVGDSSHFETTVHVDGVPYGFTYTMPTYERERWGQSGWHRYLADQIRQLVLEKVGTHVQVMRV